MTTAKVNPEKTQLGIKITVDEVISKSHPSIMKKEKEDETDTVDYYVISVEWNQARYDDSGADHLDPEQEDLRDVTVKYKIMKRFSVFKAFHDANFKHYEEFDALFPSLLHMSIFNREAQRVYRRESLDAYLRALSKATLQPNVLAAFAVFIELHSPPSCELERMTKFKNELKIAANSAASNQTAPPKRARSNSVSFRPLANGEAPLLRGYAIDDMVRIVKNGSSFHGREAKVTDPNWHGLVKVEVTGLIGLKAGAKTYKLIELELISRPEDDAGSVMVKENAVVLGTGVLLLPLLRRHLEYSGVITDKGLEATNKVTRLLDENKKLRLELEDLHVIIRSDVKEGKLEKLSAVGAAATKEAERLRAERNALMKELDDSKKKNDDVHRRLMEVDKVLAQANQPSEIDKKPVRQRPSYFGGGSKKKSDVKGNENDVNLAAKARQILAASRLSNGRFVSGGGAGGTRNDSDGSMNSFDTSGDNRDPSPHMLPQPATHDVNYSNQTSPASSKNGTRLENADLDVTLQEAIDTINSRESAASVLNGFKRLINLSLNSQEHAIQFSDMGGIVGVAALLEEYERNSAIQEKALKLLVNLSFVSEEASREMVKQGIVKRVVVSLQTHPKIIGVQVKGLWSLKNLAHHYEGALEVKECGGIELATKSIKNMITDGPIVDQGLGILQNIAHHVGPQPINLAWNASGISFAELKRIHASRTHTVDIASYLEQDIFVH